MIYVLNYEIFFFKDERKDRGKGVVDELVH